MRIDIEETRRWRIDELGRVNDRRRCARKLPANDSKVIVSRQTFQTRPFAELPNLSNFSTILREHLTSISGRLSTVMYRRIP